MAVRRSAFLSFQFNEHLGRGTLSLDRSPGAIERLTIPDLALRMWRYGLLPRERNVVYDAGNFLGILPYLTVPTPDHLKMTSEFASIGRIGSVDAHVGAGAAFFRIGSADGVEFAHKIFSALAGEEHSARIGRPPLHHIIGGMKCQLLGRSAFGRDEIDVEIPVAIARKCDPLAVGRKPRIDIACFMDRNPFDVLAALVRRPDITEVGENNAALKVMGITHQLYFPAESSKWQATCQ